MKILKILIFTIFIVFLGDCYSFGKGEFFDNVKHKKSYFVLPYIEDSPVLTSDDEGETYLAVLERMGSDSQIGIFKVLKEKRVRMASLSVVGSRGISPPSLIGLRKGILVAFSTFGKKTFNQLHCVYINQAGKKLIWKKINTPGITNILPKFAKHGNKVCMVWENNFKSRRNICQIWLDEKFNLSPVKIISSPLFNNNNPDIVCLKNGDFFVAWDSFRDGFSNIYGVYCKNGCWQKEFRVTTGKWIEKHVSLTAFKNDIWMCWQAQSYNKNKLLSIIYQDIYIAKLNGYGKLQTMSSSFDRGISQHGKRKIEFPGRYLRPKLIFSPSGKLILTARYAKDIHDCWYPVMWIYNGKKWSQQKILYFCYGRWSPVSISFKKSVIWTSFQIDNVPGSFGIDYGDYPPWKCEVQVLNIEMPNAKAVLPYSLIPFSYLPSRFDSRRRVIDSNAIQERQTINFNGRSLKLFFGNLHTHSAFSICLRAVNPPVDDLFAIERDVDRLDFVALTDHGYSLDYSIWKYIRERVVMYHDPGQFVTFLGEEWTSSRVSPHNKNHSIFRLPKTFRYGHHNIIFKNPDFEKFYDSRDGSISPADVAKDITEKEDFIMIPHQLADWQYKGKSPPVDWIVKDEFYTPLAEIYQTRGSYEYLGAPHQAKNGAPFKGLYLQDAWERGIVIGTIASPDHPGGSGYTGLWSEDLSRDSLFKAFHSRHTFGTTGEKIALFFSSGNSLMGDKVKRSGNQSIGFQIKVKSHDRVNEVVIFRNNKIVFQIDPSEKVFTKKWIDKNVPDLEILWYYIRIKTKEGYMAWSSPIWFFKKIPVLKRFKPSHYTGINNIGHLDNHGETFKEFKTKKIKHGQKGYQGRDKKKIEE